MKRTMKELAEIWLLEIGPERAHEARGVVQQQLTEHELNWRFPAPKKEVMLPKIRGGRESECA